MTRNRSRGVRCRTPLWPLRQVSAGRITRAPQGTRGSCSTGRTFAVVLGSILHNSVLSQEGLVFWECEVDGLYDFWWNGPSFKIKSKKILTFFFFFSISIFFLHSKIGKWCHDNLSSVGRISQVTQGRFLGEKKWGRSYVHELPGWNRWFDDAANLSSPIFSKDTISCLLLKPTFCCCCFSKKKQTCFILFIPGSFIQSWGYFKMRLDFAVEVVGHTRSESSKDLGRAIGPGNFAACAVRMESFGRKPHAQNPPKCPAAEGISLEGLVQGQPWIILPE